MKLLPVFTLTAALAAVALPLAAQQGATSPLPPAVPYDTTTKTPVEGTVDTMEWSNFGSILHLQPASGPMWDITLPPTEALTNKGIGGNNMTRGTKVTANVYKSKDGACTPNCKGDGIDLAIDGKPAVTVYGATAPAAAPAPARGGGGGGRGGAGAGAPAAGAPAAGAPAGGRRGG